LAVAGKIFQLYSVPSAKRLGTEWIAGRISLPAQRDLKKQGKLRPNAACAARSIRLNSMRARETRRRPEIAEVFFSAIADPLLRKTKFALLWIAKNNK